MTNSQTDLDDYDADEEPEYLDCERCDPTDGSSEYPDCTCD